MPKTNLNLQDPQIRTCLFFALKILQKKDYTEQSLSNKLESQKKWSSEVIQTVLEYLKTQKYLDNRRVLGNYIQSHLGQKGHHWLKNKLLTKGFNSQEINQELNNFSEQISEQLKNHLAKKYAIEDWTRLDWSTKQKVYRFLYSRGYTNPQQILSKLTQSTT